MNILQKTSDYIARMRAKATEVEIEIGGEPYMATVGSTLFKTSGDFGGGVYYRSVDFLVSADEFLAMPTTDDVVTWGEKTYAIVSYNGEPPVRYSDPSETTYRIHCKEIA